MMRIIACFATTLDGRIGSATNLNDRIGTRADLAHLLTVRNQADAILCGGETFRQHPSVRQGNQQQHAPLQCVLTKTFNMPPQSRLFVDSVKPDSPDPLILIPMVPILIFSPQVASPEIRGQYPTHTEWQTVNETNPVPDILNALEQRQIRTLMVEGGGHIMNLFLQAKAVQELYLTICPLLLGGISDPGLVTGPGFRVANAPRTEMIESKWVDQELYLHLKILYPES